MADKPAPVKQGGEGNSQPQQHGGSAEGKSQQQQSGGSSTQQAGQTIFKDWASI